MSKIVAAVVGLAAWIVIPPTASAQGFAGGEYERALSPGAYIPFQDMNYNRRYAYGTGSFFYPTLNPRTLIYLEYLDRLDRAQRFGYRIPQDPLQPGALPARERPVRAGFGLGFFRWR